MSTAFIHCCRLVVLAALVTGCASTGPPFQLTEPQANSALIYLYRPASMVSGGNYYLASVNGKVVARLKPGSYFALELPPGGVVVACKAASAFGICWPGNVDGALEEFLETDQFEVTGGSRYFVHFPSGKRISSVAEALAQIAGTEMLAPPR